MNEPASFVDVLRLRADSHAERAVYEFLVDGEADIARLACGELDRLARGVAVALREHVTAADRVILIYPPGLDYIAGFFGCLYAGAIAVPVYPPHPTRLAEQLPRLVALVRDCGAAAVLAPEDVVQMAEFIFEVYPELGRLRWIATTPGDLSARAGEWRDPHVRSTDVALLQYTSGSTAEPRGVMVRHGNLLHNSRHIQNCFEVTPESVGVIWLPNYHDMGLVGGILSPLLIGMRVVLMSPLSFLQRPLRWLQAISRQRATVSGGPNFAYELCARKVRPEDRQSLDLSSWRVAFNGAEVVRPETLERFADAFGCCGFERAAFYPCYGLAEATLIVTGGAAAREPVVASFDADGLERGRASASGGAGAARRLTGCGRSLPDQRVIVVEPERREPLSPGQIGEVWVAGPSVAAGYWRREAETAESFCARLSNGDGSFLRTGDLGFLREDGELFVTGRIKDLIIIAGRNLHPPDLEHTVERSHRAIRPGCSAAFGVDRDGEERLVVLAELDERLVRSDAAAPDEIAREVRRSVADAHQVQAHDVVLLASGAIPKTSSGKIRRFVCRRAYLEGTLQRL
jgi:acyl-CoA synthetase (AMP-forming)/AMP-acid ligase II